METFIYSGDNIEIKAEGREEKIYDRETYITINGIDFIQISSHDIDNFKNDFLKLLDEYMIVLKK